MATSAAQLLKEYKQYNPNAYAQAIEDEYNKRTNFNKDLIDQQNALRGEQIALPGQLRDEYYNSPIRNALAQESLIGQRQGNIQAQLGATTDFLNARGQQYSDILNKAQQGYLSNMENAWRLYQDQANREEAARNRAASSAGQGSMADILKALMGGGGGKPPKPAEKMYNVDTQTTGQKAVNAITQGRVALNLPSDPRQWNALQSIGAAGAGLLSSGGSNILKFMPEFVKSQGGLLNTIKRSINQFR